MEKTKTTKFLGSFSLSKNGGGAGGTTNYDDLTNKPKVNGIVLSGNKTSADLGITTLTPFPSTWPTTGKFEDLLAAIRVDTIAVKGASFLGEVTFDDLPANLGNAEIKIEILEGTTSATKVIHSVITSGNREPYRWEYTSWNSGNSNSGWISFQLPLTAGDGISIENNVISATGGNVYTQSNLLAGKGIEIVNEPVGEGVDANTLLCLHLDGSLDDSAAYGGTAAQVTEDSSHTAVSYGDGKFGQALFSNYNYFSYTDNKFTGAFADGKLTVDFWLKMPSINSSEFLCYGKAGTENKFIVGVGRYYSGDGNVDIYLNVGGTNVDYPATLGTPTFVESEFNHFAFVLNSSTATIYINGTKVYQKPITGNFGGITSLAFETGQKTPVNLTTSVDEVRISNVERWTSDFEPPTQAYSLAIPTGNKVINNTITKTSQLTNDSGFLNGLPDNVVTTDTQQNITAKKTFTEQINANGGIFWNSSEALIQFTGTEVYVGSNGSSSKRTVLASGPTPIIRRYDNGVVTYTNIDSGNIKDYLPTASTTTAGAVKVDGTTITADSNGVISAAIPTKAVTSDNVTKIVKLTQAEYTNLETKDESTLYIIIG